MYVFYWNFLAVTENSCCTFSTGTFLLLPYTLHCNILAVRSPLEHCCSYPKPSTRISLLYVPYWNVLAVILYRAREHSCCTFSTRIFLLLLYTIHWNILTVILHLPPEISCSTFSTGIFLVLPYTLHCNILAGRFLLEHSCCYPIPFSVTSLLYVQYRNILAATLYPPLEHSCCTFSTGIFLLLPYTVHRNILAVRFLLEHSCCYTIPFTGTSFPVYFLLEHSCSYPIPSTRTSLLHVLYWNILALTLYPPLEYPCSKFSTGIFLLLPYTLHCNILAVRSLLEHSCFYRIPSTGTSLLYVLYWNILAVTLYRPPEHPCSTFSTGTFLLLPYTLHWNILAIRSLLEYSCCYPIPSTGTSLPYVLKWNMLAVTLYPPV